MRRNIQGLEYTEKVRCIAKKPLFKLMVPLGNNKEIYIKKKKLTKKINNVYRMDATEAKTKQRLLNQLSVQSRKQRKKGPPFYLTVKGEA